MAQLCCFTGLYGRDQSRPYNADVSSCHETRKGLYGRDQSRPYNRALKEFVKTRRAHQAPSPWRSLMSP